MGRQQLQLKLHARDIVEEWLATKAPATRQAYGDDMKRFAKWLDAKDHYHAARRLLSRGTRSAHSLVVRYRAYLEAGELSPSTINRAISAIRSLTQYCCDQGDISWTCRVRGLPTQAYRNTRGPDRSNLRAILVAAETHPFRLQASRDSALLHLIYALGLRRSEALLLDIRHLDTEQLLVQVKGKGKRERIPMTVPGWAMAKVLVWLQVHPRRREQRAPLFVSLRGGKQFERLSGGSTVDLLTAACKRAGVKRYTPHALRHAAITHGLDATDGNVRQARAFSRHAVLSTLQIYDDNRTDGGGEIAELLNPSREED